MIRNKNQFLVNSEIQHIDTRQHTNFHQPSVNMTKYQKGVYYLGFKVFNMLSSYIKIEFDNPKKFKMVLQKCLYENPFYSLDEFLNFKKVNSTYYLDRHMKDLAHIFLFYLLNSTFISLYIYICN